MCRIGIPLTKNEAKYKCKFTWCCAILNGNGNLVLVIFVVGGTLVIFPYIIGVGVHKIIWALLMLLMFVLKFVVNF